MRNYFTVIGFCVLMASINAAYAHEHTMDMDMNMDMHEAHQHHHAETVVSNRTVLVNVPEVSLIRQDGAKVEINKVLADDKLAVLSFIYTSCQNICPLTSQTLSQLQKKIPESIGRVHLVSISIDPENDTPRKLANYAAKYHAAKNWDHFTGTIQASIAVQKAFDVFQGDKMNHAPVYFVKTVADGHWERVDGLVSADVLLNTLERGSK